MERVAAHDTAAALDTLARDPTLGDNPLLAARVEEVIQKTLAASMN